MTKGEKVTHYQNKNETIETVPEITAKDIKIPTLSTY